MKTTKRNSGAVLVVVMGMSAILILAGVSLTMMTANKAHQARKLRDGAQALSIAEAGIADNIDKMKTNYLAWLDATNSGVFMEGSFTAISSFQPNKTIRIASYGTANSEERSTVIEIIADPDILKQLTIDGIGIFGLSTMLLDGNDIVLASVHANDDVTFSKGSVSGQVTSAGTVDASGGGTTVPTNGAFSSGVAEKTLDDPFDFNDWYVAATNNGIYHAGPVALSGVLRPTNGVIYVNGDVTFNNGTDIIGCVVAKGNIEVHNSLTQTNFGPGLPAFLADGDILFRNRNSYFGTIYCTGDFSSDNQRVIIGVVIAEGAIEISNHFHLEAPEADVAWGPDGNADPDVEIGAWLK